MKLLFVFIVLAFVNVASAEERWVSATLERTPIVDKRGNVVERPVYHARDRKRVTTGGEWVVPKELKVKAIERYQRNGELLMRVDVPTDIVLPNVKAVVNPEKVKKEKFGILPVAIIEPESGVTK